MSSLQVIELSQVRGGSGRRPGGVARRGEDSAARGRRQRCRGGCVEVLRAALGQRGWRTWPARAAAAARAEKQRRRERGIRRGTGLQFPEKIGIPL
jgi:hypothetical protein